MNLWRHFLHNGRHMCDARRNHSMLFHIFVTSFDLMIRYPSMTQALRIAFLISILLHASSRAASDVEPTGGLDPTKGDGDDPITAAEEQWRLEAKQQVYASIRPVEAIDFAKLQPAKPGEWLSVHNEPPQTMEKYKLATRVRPTEKRTTIVLQPLGEVDESFKKTLAAMCEYAHAYFQMPARVAEPLPLKIDDAEKPFRRLLPVGNRHGIYDHQFNADLIIDDLLARKVPDDAVVYLGITMEDIWTSDLHYVFGLGTLDKRVGVYSLVRFYPEFWGNERKAGDDVIALRRACKVLNHETGHMFGLTHCVFFRCTMNGSNSLTETDGAPVHECPLCQRKLQWNIGYNPAKRFEALRAFYEKNKLAPEAEWLAARMKHWDAAQKIEHAPGDE
jgi:archaemetzincin